MELVDRFFPLVWLGLYLLLPVTGDGASALVTNFDQSRDLEALRSVLADGRADAIANNLIGPAYVATAAVVHWAIRLSPEDSLIFLTRTSFALSVAVCLVLVRVLVRRLVPSPASVSLAAQFALMTLVFVAGTWHWSDIPWSHFYAALLAVAFYAVRFGPARVTPLAATVAAALLALLALTRSFEFLAVVAAWGLGLGLLAAVRVARVSRPRLGVLAPAALAFVATAAVVYGVTGKRGSFLLYRSSSGENYGDLRPEEVATIPTFDFGLVPRKLVQIFVDPCFDSLCTVNDYVDHASWSMPLAIQLPSLVLLPLCVVGAGAIVVWSARHHERARSRARELALLVESTIAATGLTVGYVASTWASSSALKYGFARDFLLAALLTGIVAVALAFAGVHLLLRRTGGIRVPGSGTRMSPGSATALVAILGATAMVLAAVAVRSSGLPRLDGSHLREIRYTAHCAGDSCSVELVAESVAGTTVSIPQSSLLTFGCGSAEPKFTLYVRDPSEQFPLDEGCSGPRLVAAWPTVMGVPPNSSALRVVDVANATS